MGQHAVESILQERQNGPYKSLFDFVRRNASEALNKRTLESLIKAGAFDSLGLNRAQLLSVYERAMEDSAQKRKANIAGQVSLFDMGMGLGTGGDQDMEAPPIPEHPLKVLLSMEKEMTGVYISGHPLDEVAQVLQSGFTTAQDVAAAEERTTAWPTTAAW